MKTSDDKNQDDNAYLLPSSKLKAVLQPTPSDTDQPAAPAAQTSGGSTEEPNAAADLIRHKLEKLYAEEPDAQQEAREVKAVSGQRSKHQEFMHQLSVSGQSLEAVQTAWHQYYVALPDAEKREVWQEFYDAQATAKSAGQLTVAPQPATTAAQTQPTAQTQVTKKYAKSAHTSRGAKDRRSVADIKGQLLSRVADNNKRGPAKQHFQSLAFGLATGALVILILLFGFFNERFLAPFITPSRAVSATPIIIDPNSSVAGPNPEVIIPKINVEIPVVYDVPTIDDNAVESALERGVVHYATSPNPGEQGNVVVVGHSSNNILNRGKYKFAFVLLSHLDNGDVFYLSRNGVRYAYQVYSKRIVKPTDVSVLGPADKPSTATLITCDPPGTSINRLVVTGVQISPDPGGNKASSASGNAAQPTMVPGNSESLWHRLTSWISG